MVPRQEAPHSEGQVLPFRASLLAMLGLCFVTMLVALDQTVVGTAMPTIVAELRGFDLYAWVATSYLLTSVITVPIFGRLGDYFGRKPFVVISIILFTAASLLCGAANSMLFLVIARALQGIGGGMLVGTAFASIADLFPDAKVRLRWQVVMSIGFGVGSAVGPSLGGFLTESWGWRWVFFVNLPIGLLSLFFVWRFLPYLRNHMGADKIKIDWFGAVLIAVALGSLQLLVEMLPKEGLSTWVIVLFALTVGGFWVLWKWEQVVEQPIVPIDMLRHKPIAVLFVLSLLLGFVMFGLLMYTPLLFQGGFSLSPREAGLLITPLVVCITVASILNSRVVVRLRNPNWMLYIGLVFIALCCLGVMVLEHDTPRAFIFSVMLIGGLGLGLVMPNLTVFTQQTAAREYLGIATALLQSLRMIGGMLGTAICGVLINHIYTRGVVQALESQHASQWVKEFSDPDVLINHDIQSALLAEMLKVGHNGSLLLDEARASLVTAIHSGIALLVVVCFIGMWVVRYMPLIKLGGKKVQTVDLE
jgi:EmrB/QacA subfamily drug resistance transporter